MKTYFSYYTAFACLGIALLGCQRTKPEGTEGLQIGDSLRSELNKITANYRMDTIMNSHPENVLLGDWYGVDQADTIYLQFSATSLRKRVGRNGEWISHPYTIEGNMLLMPSAVTDTSYFVYRNNDAISIIPKGTVSKDGVKMDLVRIEEFRTFMRKFNADSAFQLERILFPLDFYFHEDITEPRVFRKMEREEWGTPYVFGPDSVTSRYRYGAYTNQVVEMGPDEILWNSMGVDNGISGYFYFKRIQAKWYLVKFINDSN